MSCGGAQEGDPSRPQRQGRLERLRGRAAPSRWCGRCPPPTGGMMVAGDRLAVRSAVIRIALTCVSGWARLRCVPTSSSTASAARRSVTRTLMSLRPCRADECWSALAREAAAPMTIGGAAKLIGRHREQAALSRPGQRLSLEHHNSGAARRRPRWRGRDRAAPKSGRRPRARRHRAARCRPAPRRCGPRVRDSGPVALSETMNSRRRSAGR